MGPGIFGSYSRARFPSCCLHLSGFHLKVMAFAGFHTLKPIRGNSMSPKKKSKLHKKQR
jgi:hypothetical protein